MVVLAGVALVACNNEAPPSPPTASKATVPVVATAPEGSATAPAATPQAPSTYHGIEIDPTSHAITIDKARLDPQWSLSWSRDVHYKDVELLGPTGACVDSILFNEKGVRDWYHFRRLGATPLGSLVIEDRFEPPFPDGDPYPFYKISSIHGETATELPLEPRGTNLLATDLVYVYKNGGLLVAQYNADGALRVVMASHGLRTSCGYPDMNIEQFAAYALPLQLDADVAEPPINDALLSGLGHVTVSSYSPSPLQSRWLIAYSASDQKIWTNTISATGTKESRLLQFGDWPYSSRQRGRH